MKRLFFLISCAFIIISSIQLVRLLSAPRVDHLLGEAQPNTPLQLRYYGTSTLLFDDGETQIMVDGFFTRPDFATLAFKRFSPNESLLKRVIQEEQLTRLAAVIPVHSHHDHAMDSGLLAKLTGATLLGSQSSAHLAHQWLTKEQITIAEHANEYHFGQFTVILLESRHVPMPAFLHDYIGMGQAIDNDVSYPAKLSDYKEGKSYSLLIKHPRGRYLVQSSAGFIPGLLDSYKVDVALVGIAGLGNQTEDYLNNYLQATVHATGAHVVIPIHWESFAKPASEQALPLLIDDIQGTLQKMEQRLERKHITVKRLPVRQIQ